VELGPLDVGLEQAASKAMTALPRGGRLVGLRPRRIAAHLVGAIGSTGCVIAGVLAFIAWTMRSQPMSMIDVALRLAIVIVGGASLAAVLHATDRAALPTTHSAEIMGQRVRRILRNMARLSCDVACSPSDLGPRRVTALKRLLTALHDPEIERWIPIDVRGRAELLLARACAREGGPAWAKNVKLRSEVRALLSAATRHLADPSAAESDLAALDHAAAVSRSRISMEDSQEDSPCDPAEDEDEVETTWDSVAELRASHATRHGPI